jgi:hypothetical protein
VLEELIGDLPLGSRLKDRDLVCRAGIPFSMSIGVGDDCSFILPKPRTEI